MPSATPSDVWARRNSGQLDVHFDEPEMQRLHRLAALPRAELSAPDAQWLDARIDGRGQHLIGIYGLGFYTPEEKVRVDAERDARKKAKDAAAAAAKAKTAAAAAAAAPKPAEPTPTPTPPPATGGAQ